MVQNLFSYIPPCRYMTALRFPDGLVDFYCKKKSACDKSVCLRDLFICVSPCLTSFGIELIQEPNYD